MIFVGDDWAESHHDVHVMDETGERLASRRLPEGLDGIRGFHELVAEHVDEPSGVVVGIETDRGLWVDALTAAGYQVYAINPVSVSRYRDRHNLAGAKSDQGDAKVLADLVRTDRHNHRPIAGDTSEVEAVKVLARAHQNLVWARTRHTNQLRNSLREYYPAALEAFDDLDDRDTLAILERAPSPEVAARLSVTQIRAALKRGGRQRNLDRRAEDIQAAFRSEQLAAPDPVAVAFAAATKATVGILKEMNRQLEELEATLADRFEQHPDAVIYLSMPGLGDVLGARALGEFGDDPNRYATTKSRKNYAGTSPITIASGKKRAVLARHVRNRRLYDAIDQWAFCSLQASAGCRRLYDQRRDAGDLHHQALRALGNRLVGILHGCLRHQTTYDEHTAWAHRQATSKDVAA
ncbi:MAG: IS110 family transposase [Acidimicrobiia bacterium]